MQHGMSEEQRQVMEAHLHPESAPSGGPATVQHVHAEVGGLDVWGKLQCGGPPRELSRHAGCRCLCGIDGRSRLQ